MNEDPAKPPAPPEDDTRSLDAIFVGLLVIAIILAILLVLLVS